MFASDFSANALHNVLLAALAASLLIAAFTDLRSRIIPNWLNLSIAICAPVWWFAVGLTPMGIGLQLLICLITFGIACLLFASGQMGGGDVKLLTALALWFPPLVFSNVLILMALAGGGASIIMAFFNMRRMKGERAKNILAACVTALWASIIVSMIFAIATGRSLISPLYLKYVVEVLPAFWALPVALVIVCVLLFTGFRHIMKRQKSRLEVPYGVAIAAAALWAIMN